jgi:hypothetical protein
MVFSRQRVQGFALPGARGASPAYSNLFIAIRSFLLHFSSRDFRSAIVCAAIAAIKFSRLRCFFALLSI